MASGIGPNSPVPRPAPTPAAKQSATLKQTAPKKTGSEKVANQPKDIDTTKKYRIDQATNSLPLTIDVTTQLPQEVIELEVTVNVRQPKPPILPETDFKNAKLLQGDDKPRISSESAVVLHFQVGTDILVIHSGNLMSYPKKGKLTIYGVRPFLDFRNLTKNEAKSLHTHLTKLLPTIKNPEESACVKVIIDQLEGKLVRLNKILQQVIIREEQAFEQKK